MHRTILAGVCVILAACGGPAAEPVEETEATETSGSEEAQIAWADMNQEQRGHYMATVVVPRMRPMFQEFDAEEFAEFNCATCHGDTARDVGFHMPNGLHPLNAGQIPSMFESEDPEVQRVAQFMGGVMTTMAELVGEQPYDPETHEGFSCMNCHAAEQ